MADDIEDPLLALKRQAMGRYLMYGDDWNKGDWLSSAMAQQGIPASALQPNSPLNRYDPDGPSGESYRQGMAKFLMSDYQPGQPSATGNAPDSGASSSDSGDAKAPATASPSIPDQATGVPPFTGPVSCRVHVDPATGDPDFGGVGYGKITRPHLWGFLHTHPDVKYGQYDCSAGPGDKFSIQGPGEPGTYDLYGVQTRYQLGPDGWKGGSVPYWAYTFTVDPAKPDEYTPEMFDAVRKRITDCKKAGTCLDNDVPEDPGF